MNCLLDYWADLGLVRRVRRKFFRHQASSAISTVKQFITARLNYSHIRPRHPAKPRFKLGSSEKGTRRGRHLRIDGKMGEIKCKIKL